MLAVMHCGAIAVPISTRWTKQEISAAVQSCKPKLIFCDSASLSLLGSDHESYVVFLVMP